MSSGSLPGGGPRPGERSRGAATGADVFARSYHRWALAASLVAMWGLISLMAFAFGALGVEPLALVAFGTAPLVVLVGVVLLARRGWSRIAAAALTFAMAFAAAGHVLGPLAGPLPAAFPPAWAALAAALVVAPLVAGWRAHALDLALLATGRKPRFLPVGALFAKTPDELLRGAPRDKWGPLRRYAEGWSLPGLLVMDAAFSVGLRIRPHERMHFDADLDELGEAFVAVGATSERRERKLHVTLPSGGRVVITRHALAFPSEAACVLHIRGHADAAHAARQLLETDLAHVGRAAWTRQGLRWEARLNALLRDAATSQTLEERSALLEEAQRVETLLDARDLMAEERALLRGWKAQRLRVVLSTKLLSEPVGPRAEGRLLAPAPALEPALPLVLEAGGLAVVRRAAFVPHWIVPVRTSWGEHEAVVNALTHKVDAAESEALLRAAREQGASLFVHAPRGPTFLPVPEPTAAMLRELRETLPRADVATAATAADTLLVPYLPTTEGYLSGVTGSKAADLGPAPGVAAKAAPPA